MQQEFETQYPDLDIAILGVNEVGFEGGNEGMCDGRDLPWLQDTAAADWWGVWAPTYRDVIILDGDGELAGVFNLTDKPITVDDNYVELKQLLVDVAERG